MTFVTRANVGGKDRGAKESLRGFRDRYPASREVAPVRGVEPGRLLDYFDALWRSRRAPASRPKPRRMRLAGSGTAAGSSLCVGVKTALRMLPVRSADWFLLRERMSFTRNSKEPVPDPLVNVYFLNVLSKSRSPGWPWRPTMVATLSSAPPSMPSGRRKANCSTKSLPFGDWL